MICKESEEDSCMRNRKWVLLSAAGLLFILVGVGAYTDYQAGNNQPAVSDTIQQPPSALPSVQAATSPNPSSGAAQNPGPYVDLVPGDGKDEVQYNCGLCHSLSYITMRPPISAQNWEHEVNMMRGFYGASLSDSTARKIVQYLGSHYTPETVKR